jgi:2-oxo-hept-3-ene-1,7-dioate hydratase
VADATSIDRAMKAQLQRFRDALVAGMPRLGWKIGINERKILERFGLEQPVVGWLAGDRALASDARYVLRPATRVAVEAEVAARVGGGGAVAALAPALEIVNYSLPGDSFEEILANDVFHDAVVLGRETLPVPIVDDVWPELVRNGVPTARRDPTRLVLQPIDMIRHVAKTLARYGECLETGDWLILGTLIQPVSVRAGDRITADFGPLGRVSVSIAAA